MTAPGLQGPAQSPSAQRPRALAVLQTAGWNVASREAQHALERTAARVPRPGLRVTPASPSVLNCILGWFAPEHRDCVRLVLDAAQRPTPRRR
jgi:hypothetical protein